MGVALLSAVAAATMLGTRYSPSIFVLGSMIILTIYTYTVYCVRCTVYVSIVCLYYSFVSELLQTGVS